MAGIPCGGCDKDTCRLCLLAKTDPTYRALWGLPADHALPPPAETSDALACAYRGDRPLAYPTAVSLNLPNPARAWYGCAHPRRPLKTLAVGSDGNAYVCKCTGCGPACTGYATDLPASPPAARLVVTNGAGGLGDSVLGLVAVTALRRADPARHIEYRVGHRGLPFAAMFRGYDTLASRDDPMPDGVEVRDLNAGYDDEVRTKCREPRIARYCRNVGVRAPARPVLPALRDHAEVLAAGSDMRGVVAICPFSYGGDREYSTTGWRAVEAALRRDGYRVVVVHSDARRCWAFSSEKVAGVPPLRTAGVLLNAAAVLGIDSGLTHLAAALGTPTVVLEGPTNVAGIFAAYANVTRLAGPYPCSGCHWNGPWHRENCSPRCPSIQGVDPARVVEAAKAAALLPPAAAARTLFLPKKLVALRDAIRGTAGVRGDVAELGVYRGGSAALLCKYAGDSQVHLFDTFAGLPADCPEGRHVAGEFAATEADVVGFLRGLGYAPVVRAGVFPATAPPGRPKFRFVHVDGDLYRTTADAIAYFRPRMSRGGVMLFDDYGWVDTPGVARAVDEALPGRAERVGDHQAAVKF